MPLVIKVSHVGDTDDQCVFLDPLKARMSESLPLYFQQNLLITYPKVLQHLATCCNNHYWLFSETFNTAGLVGWIIPTFRQTRNWNKCSQPLFNTELLLQYVQKKVLSRSYYSCVFTIWLLRRSCVYYLPVWLSFDLHMCVPTTRGAFHSIGLLIQHNTCRVCILFPVRPSPSLLSRCLTRGNQNAFVKTHRSACNFTSTVTHFWLATSGVRHFLLYY